MSERLVRVVWTATAKKCLRKLPVNVRRGLLDKARRLQDCDNPREAHKPLTGPLAHYYRITYARYRAIYTVSEEVLANGDLRVLITVCFVACGIRKEGDKKDVYRLAKNILKYGGFGDARVVRDPESDGQ